MDVCGACIEDLTYRHIDLRTTCIAILSTSGKAPQKKMKHPIKTYFRVSRIEDPRSLTSDSSFQGNDAKTEGLCPYVYTASINWTSSVVLHLHGTTSALTETGFVCYSNRLAYYETREAALRAVIVRTLVKVATERAVPGNDPKWASKLLPLKQTMGSEENKRRYVVLYQNGNTDRTNDKLFGFLHERFGKRVLSIPRDYEDLTQPWEDFVFDEYTCCLNT